MMKASKGNSKFKTLPLPLHPFALRTKEELFNTFTHVAGVLFTLVTAGFLFDLGLAAGWKFTLGTVLFLCGMLLMFTASSIYHWCLPGLSKQRLRIADHIGIYVMIAASYTPICIGVVDGVLGWTVFGLQWAAVVAGIFYKMAAIGKYPRFSLFVYLLLGWSVVFIAEPVYTRLTATTLWFILGEGLFYTSGTYFYAHDHRKYFHGIWHIFVLWGAVCHWVAVWTILKHVPE